MSERTADMRRVLIVDDEASITDAVATALRYEGFDTCEIDSGRAAVSAIDEFRPDLIILDVMLPDLDGLAVARRLRDRRMPVPVIFLSAKDATEDKIAGLALGDDYVTKPFSLAELVARVQTVLRRTQGDDGHVLRFADVELDDDTRQVRRGEEPLDLTPTEFRLLRFLLQNPRRVLSKRQILDNVWNYDFGGDANVVETYVSYLRRKLDRVRAAADPHRSARRLRAARTGSLMRLRGRSGGRVGAAVGGMSLRARLLVVLAVLSGTGLLIADVATYAALRSSLFKRVDSSLDSTANGIASSLNQFDRLGPGPGGPLRRINFLAQFGVLTPGTYVEIRPGNGAPVVRGTLTRPGESGAGATHPERLRPGRRRRAAEGDRRRDQRRRSLPPPRPVGAVCRLDADPRRAAARDRHDAQPAQVDRGAGHGRGDRERAAAAVSG